MQRLINLSTYIPGALKLPLFMFVGLALSFSNRASADLILSFGSGSVVSGGVGYIDLFVESGSSESTFTLFNYKVEISPVSVINGGILEFQESFDSPNSLRQLSTEQGMTNYIFAGKSTFDNFTSVRQDPNRLQLVGGDVEATGTPITILAGQSYLLARLELQHITPTPGLSTGSFRVSLLQDPAQSYFQDLDLDDSDPAQPKIDPLSYSIANSGTVTITAVPEPSSMLLVGGAFGIAAFVRRRAPKVRDGLELARLSGRC